MSKVKLTKNRQERFKAFIWAFYRRRGRQFAWRKTNDPYKILISEVMLQQTQTHRVAPKYEDWLIAFPDFSALAQASLRDILSIWQGLGYNRRCKALQAIAQSVMIEFGGILPSSPEKLQSFPGIGSATAASICAFAFNVPTIFIETNIRAVFIHSFFRNEERISDRELLPLVEQTIDRENPREWYYALMDYGVELKKNFSNPTRKSKNYTKQSRFEGSDRQIRGMILKELTHHAFLEQQQIFEKLEKGHDRIKRILDQLIAEKFITKNNNRFTIAS